MKTVLVVDDDDALRETMCDALTDEGYLAVGRSDGQAALVYLRSAPELPCVIFLDLMMPVMNGWQFREAQRRDPGLALIPVVVVTANGRSARDSIDANEVVMKPVRLDKLLHTAQRFCTC